MAEVFDQEINPTLPGANGAKGADGGASVVPPDGVVTVGGGGDLPAVTMTVLSLNSAPTRPTGLSVTPAPTILTDVTVRWNPSSDAESDSVTYTLQRRFATLEALDTLGAWAQVYAGEGTSFTDTIPEGWGYVQWRVQAADEGGASAGWLESTRYAVDQNRAPTISGEDEDKGVMSGAFEYAFSVNDPDGGDALAVAALLDGMEIMRVPDAQRGVEYVAEITRELYLKATDGEHTLLITATDGKGARAERRIAWRRCVMGVDVIIESREPEADMPTQISLSPFVGLTLNGSARYMACNNSFDEEPAWEDITASVVNRRVYLLGNTEKEAEGWGVAVRIMLAKGSIPGMIYYKEAGVQYR